MFGIISKKKKIQSLEAKVRGLIKENQELQVERNDHRLRSECYRKALDMVSKKRAEEARSLAAVDNDETDDLPFK